VSCTIGIDASNLRRGGGITHLVELVSATKPELHNIAKVVIWGSHKTLDLLEDQTWLIKITPQELNLGSIYRLYWQKFKLSRAAIAEGCNLLFVPGGSCWSNFRPIVTMSRNMLPFQLIEIRRYGLSWISVRLLLLRLIQTKSFRRADGLIFLTKFAKGHIQKITGKLSGFSEVIPHGLNLRFHMEPKEQYDISKYSLDKPFQLLYVSIVDQYKHQWCVVEAVSQLRNKGYPVLLNIVGPAYPPALKRLRRTINKLDQNNDWVNYHGDIPYEDLHNIYQESHLGIFASSCENMPNILLETMAAGLPIACSNIEPMPEVLGNNGLYFDPEQPSEIFNTLESLINNPELRLEKANASFLEVQKYSWSICANETFSFLNKVATDYKKSLCAE
jgi:glycosyltransferase involved in cell wall biosynthesis